MSVEDFKDAIARKKTQESTRRKNKQSMKFFNSYDLEDNQIAVYGMWQSEIKLGLPIEVSCIVLSRMKFEELNLAKGEILYFDFSGDGMALNGVHPLCFGWGMLAVNLEVEARTFLPKLNEKQDNVIPLFGQKLVR